MFPQLLRVRQWYKNLLIFLPLVFAGLLLDPKSILLTLLGFLALSLMSSANYILNDIIDLERDKLHPEKSQRPLASGVISKNRAAAIEALLAAASLSISVVLSPVFFLILLIFFFLTQCYSLCFKDELFLDLICISVNFVLRAMSGAFILNVRLSPWLIVCTFFLSLFIALGKRRADYALLQVNAREHKQVLSAYNVALTNTLMIIATTSLLMSYTLYSFLSIYPHLIYSLPFALYVILRYFYRIETESPIARKPEYFYQDTKLIIGVLLWTCAVILLTYLI